MKELYTTAEMAKLLKLHEKTIYNMRKEGMPFKVIGKAIRFDTDEVNEWIESRHKK